MVGELLEPRLMRYVQAAYHATPGMDPAARARLLDLVPARARVQLQLAPLAAAAIALLLLAVGAVGGALVARQHATRTAAVAARATDAAHFVRFMVMAPGARRVALVGDFNGWDPQATPMLRADPDTPWSVTVPIAPGRHVYAFVVDDHRWIPDPTAPLAPEEGFGSRNSVLVVGGS
ncbi:MAG: isoamylase early set domain-containing protein [Gemmatimonadales bacterium]